MKHRTSSWIVIVVTVAVALAVAPLAADPEAPQNPRVGQLAEITFAHDSSRLSIHSDTPVARQLGQAAAWALEHPDGLLVLDGHADRTGSSRHNARLSLARARAVHDQLVELGVGEEQIVIAAFGERGPQKKQNRRVVVWATRSGLDAVIARSEARGEPVIRAGLISQADRSPRPGAVAN